LFKITFRTYKYFRAKIEMLTEERTDLHANVRYCCPIPTTTVMFRKIVVKLLDKNVIKIRLAALELLHVDRRADRHTARLNKSTSMFSLRTSRFEHSDRIKITQ
jgi:hypothetical protein